MTEEEGQSQATVEGFPLAVPEELKQLIKDMRSDNNPHILDGILPADSYPELIGMKVSIEPYRPLSNDHPDSGTWDLCIGPDFKARIESAPSSKGVVDTVKVRNASIDTDFRAASEEEATYVQGILNFINGNRE